MRFDKSSHLNGNFLVLVAYGQLHPFTRTWALHRSTYTDYYIFRWPSFFVFGHGFLAITYTYNFFTFGQIFLFFFFSFERELVWCNLAIRIFGQPFSGVCWFVLKVIRGTQVFYWVIFMARWMGLFNGL